MAVGENQPVAPPPRDEGRSRGARALALVAGALAGLLGFALLTGGGFLLWANGALKDGEGYLTTSSERFATGTRALTLGDVHLEVGRARWILEAAGTLRLRVEPVADEAVFVGIGPARDVSAYLRDVAHAEVTDIETDPFRATLEERPGRERPRRPAGQRFWTVAAHGEGTQTVTWDLADGRWSVVLMNADGSPRVAADVSAGADVPFVVPLALALLVLGLLGLAAGAALVFLAAERPPGGDDPRPAPAPRS